MREKKRMKLEPVMMMMILAGTLMKLSLNSCCILGSHDRTVVVAVVALR